ncbi:hypothetical protein [Roseicyclus persicicus]|uniref:Uncharacterized protein n=1 Tax=Roseicyclus persicicus TaxID=2650661 RepID=A0A7X6H0M7_9RHOB|nr:hypothetical protein [Roseibacterium persicicum]NKX44696.1 hypothetical protein [Roseibacterium persicicum]
MDHADIVQYARSLYTAHGDKAEAEAAQKAAAAKGAGDLTEAGRWEKIRLHIKELRGARQT